MAYLLKFCVKISIFYTFVLYINNDFRIYFLTVAKVCSARFALSERYMLYVPAAYLCQYRKGYMPATPISAAYKPQESR
jgi:hypothetical protein